MDGSKENRVSWTGFKLSKEIRKALRDNNYDAPLPIQFKTLKAALLGDKNVLGAARTGSGKTLAYAIPIVQKILLKQHPSCAMLKRHMSRKIDKQSDFEMIDGEVFDVEDLIVDKPGELNEAEESDDSESQTGSDAESTSIDRYSCPEAIVLVPTRELAVQVKDEIEKLCKYTNIRCCCLVGGLNQDKQVRILKKSKPQIIIATPGRLFEVAQSDVVEHLNRQSLSSIRTLVIDEADRMIQKGHFQELLQIIDILKESKPTRTKFFDYRVLLFSATLTFLHELPERFKIDAPSKKHAGKKSKGQQSNPKAHNKKAKIKQMLDLIGIKAGDTKIIDLNDESSFGRPSAEQLTEFRINCLAEHKDLYLYYFLIEHPGKRVLIFCNSKDCLRRLSNVLKFLKYNVLKLHADLDQKKRLSSLEQFRKTTNAIMIATDVAARGLDIKNLDCVIHYQVPRTCESYIHRSGRTARLDLKGISLTLCEPKEVACYRRLCNTINGGRDLVDYDVDPNLKKLLEDRVALAQTCDKLDHQLRGNKSEQNWFMKAAKDCDIELDEDDFRRMGGKGRDQEQSKFEDAQKRRRLAQMEKKLAILLKKPLLTRQMLLKQAAIKVAS